MDSIPVTLCLRFWRRGGWAFTSREHFDSRRSRHHHIDGKIMFILFLTRWTPGLRSNTRTNVKRTLLSFQRLPIWPSPPLLRLTPSTSRKEGAKHSRASFASHEGRKWVRVNRHIPALSCGGQAVQALSSITKQFIIYLF